MTASLAHLSELPAVWTVLAKVTVLLAGAWVLEFSLRKRNPRWRILMWRWVFVGIALVLAAEFAGPKFDVAVAIPEASPMQPELDDSVPAGPMPPASIPPPGDPAPLREPPAVPAPGAQSAPSGPTLPDVPGPMAAGTNPSANAVRLDSTGLWLGRHWALLLAAGWGIGVLILAFRHVSALRQVRCLVKRSRPAPQAARRVLDEVAHAMGTHVQVELRVTSETISPFVAGAGVAGKSPIFLVLPEKLAEEDLPSVLAHELAHLRSHDLGWDALARWLSVLGWPHPLAWRMRAAHAAACEQACDAAAADYAGSAEAYSSVLARAALAFAAGAATRGALSMFRNARITRRIRLLEKGIRARALTRRRVVLAVMAGAVLLAVLGGVRLVRAEQEATASDALIVKEGPVRDSDEAGARFLFRRRGADGGETALVLAVARPGALELRDIATGAGTPLCIVRGEIYMSSGGKLYTIDIETGERRRGSTLPRFGESSFDSKRLCCTVGGREETTLRVYDLNKGAYRDITTLPKTGYPHGPIAVSPDHKRVACCQIGTTYPVGPQFELLVLDLDTAARRTIGPAFDFHYASSRFIEYPPFVWVDAETLLVVSESEPVAQGAMGEFNRLVAVNALTGETRDIVKLPGRAVRSRPGLRRSPWGDAVYVTAAGGRYRVDMEHGKLIEDDSVGGIFHTIAREDGVEILHGDRRIDFAQRWTGRRYEYATDLLVSPDRQCVVWSIDDGHRRKLKYYDVREGVVRIVTDAWEEQWVLWVDPEDLETPAQEPAIPQGWTPLFAAVEPPAPKEETTRVDSRGRIEEFLQFTMMSDKSRYLLHEPVVLTLSVTNISDTEIEVRRPYPDDEAVDSSLRWTKGGSSRFFPRLLTVEEAHAQVELKPGDTVTESGTFEFAEPSSYQIEARYGFRSGAWRGSYEATVEFDIESSPDDQKLLEAKLDRLVAELREECAKEMTSIIFLAGSRDATSGRIEYVIRAMKEAGPAARPYLIDAIRSETDERVMEKLYRPLTDVTSPGALPLYEERLASGTEEEKILICSGLRQLLQQGATDEKACELLISALGQAEPSVRVAAASQLRHKRAPVVERAFRETALMDSDQKVCDVAAWYLAQSENIELIEWLERAAAEPTRARYEGARLIVGKLEEHTHEEKGSLPAEDWDTVARSPELLEQFRATLRAWAAWAQEMPRFSANFF